MSAAQTLRPFNAAYVRAIRILSFDTTPEYVDMSGASFSSFSRSWNAPVINYFIAGEVPKN